MSSHLDLETIRTGADHTERPTSDRRPGLNQSRVAQTRRHPSRACMPSWKTSGLLVETGCGQSQWHLLNGEKIGAERVLRSGDELRVGNSRLIFWEVKQADEASANEATVSVKTAQLPPRLTRRELRS